MAQCRGKTKAGKRCRRRAGHSSHYCGIHKDQDGAKLNPLLIAGGMVVGNAIVPGLGGAAIGGLAGLYLGNEQRKAKMTKPKVFISFDYDHDEKLRTFLVGQARHPESPFEISDWSVKGHIPGDWKSKARARIRRADQVIVICGMNTDSATGVNEELRIAQEEGKPYVLLNGYKGKTCIKPKAAKVSDKLYPWSWDNLKKLIGGAR